MSLSNVPSQVGVLHTYGFNLTAFEITEYTGERTENLILFIGGLGNGLLNVPYIPSLAQAAARFQSKNKGKWNVAQVLLSSAYNGWGTSTLERDSKQLKKAIEYFRSKNGGNRKNIVLMGHSTGCQNSMHYLTNVLIRASAADPMSSSSSSSSSSVDYNPNDTEKYEIQGAILQASVSDQEAFRADHKNVDFDALTKEVYDEYIAQGRGKEILPEKFRKLSFNTPITAYRFHSLVSKKGDDDYFSSYLTDDDFQQTFGKVQTPLLVLYSGNDQFVPSHVNKEELIQRWKTITPQEYWSNYSRIIPGGKHDLGDGSPTEAIETLVDLVTLFINDL